MDIESSLKWNNLLLRLENLVDKKPDLNAILFLIGIQELGSGKRVFTKEQKQDLMHVATCKLLAIANYYELESVDEEGWPHWKLLKPLPFLNLNEQEEFLKSLILSYFEPIFEL
jgi:hypothetical protein